MKKTNAFIAAALAASMLTACGGTDTAEVTSAESTVSDTTAATVSETDTLSAESEETTAETSVETVESVSDMLFIAGYRLQVLKILTIMTILTNR